MSAFVFLPAAFSTPSAGLRRPRRPPPRHVAARRISMSSSSPASFPARVAGEWLGYESQFWLGAAGARQATPEPVPEHYVPEDFAAWGVRVLGFETLTSTVVDGDVLRLKRTRILPHVGCEADAVIPEVHDTSIPLPALTTFDDGSFAAVAALPLHLSLVHRAERIHVLVPHTLAATHATLIHETYDGPYRAGDNLPGCGGAVACFAEQEPVREQDVAGKWRREDGSEVERGEVGEGDVWLGFPKGVWVAGGPAGRVEVGWMVGEGEREVMVVEDGRVENWHETRV